MKKHLLPIALCVPGALFVGFFGLLAAGFGFAGTGSGFAKSDFAKFCMAFGVVFGGASLGATPGLILGYYQGLRWVCPFLGMAIGALFGLIVIDEIPQLTAGLVIAGFIFGCRSFYRSYHSAPDVLRKPL